VYTETTKTITRLHFRNSKARLVCYDRCRLTVRRETARPLPPTRLGFRLALLASLDESASGIADDVFARRLLDGALLTGLLSGPLLFVPVLGLLLLLL